MREISRIVVHCSATRPSQDIGVAEINDWHAARGWASPSGIACGYHYVIRRDGKLERGRPDHEQGAHAKRYNHDSLGVCLVGGIADNGGPEPNYSKEQLDTLMLLLIDKAQEYGEDIDVCGHRDLPRVAKACPCFDVREFWRGRDSWAVG